MEVLTSDSEIAVKQANRLIESIYRMDVNEHKLLLLATKKVNELEIRNQPFNERTKITISGAEFAHQYDISRQSAFEIILEAKKSIYNREFDYLHVEDNGEVTPMKSRWFQARGMDKGKSEISFMFASAVIPLIYLVNTEYTLLDLHEIGKLKSKYAVRLYKYLMRWVNAPYRNKVSYADLRVMFGLNEDEYPEMRDFRKRVLDIAVKQVKAGTGFNDLSVRNYKAGVKVTAFSFHYTKYENDTIKKTVKQISNSNDNPTGDYVVYQMTQDQIKIFSSSLAIKAVKRESGYAHLGDLIGAGQETEHLIQRIADDFTKGLFGPYLGVLQLAGFKPTKLNKTPLKGQSGSIIDNDVGEQGSELNGDKENPFSLSDSHYELYVKKGGKLSKDQILEAAMADNMPPIRVMLANGINILAA